jgi:hypothetical protein
MKYQLSNLFDSDGAVGIAHIEPMPLEFWKGYVAGWFGEKTVEWVQVDNEWRGKLDGHEVAIISPTESDRE